MHKGAHGTRAVAGAYRDLARMVKEELSKRGAGAAACLQFEDRPTTPKAIRKYRKSYFDEPGTRVSHPGLIDDYAALNARLGQQRLGARSDRAAEHVEDLFKGGPQGSLTAFVEQRKESVYKTQKREPLGKPYVRGHDFSTLGEERLLSSTSDSAKAVIYSSAQASSALSCEEQERVRAQYKLSHKSYEPGEKKNRSYNWNGIDPTTHQFGGAQTKADEGGVAGCLRFSVAAKDVHPAVVNHRAMTTDPLGKAKYRGLDAEAQQVLQQRLEARARSQDCSAEDCIKGFYSPEHQAPDEDLGRAVRPGYRNFVGDRVFGAPTVRTDIPPPATRSIGDSQNYGDDTTARKLLYPSAFVAAGVSDSDFLEPSWKDDIRALIERIGHVMTDAEFNKIYAKACDVTTGSPDDMGSKVVSIKAFLSVMNERLRALDRGREPAWWNDS